MTDYIKPRSIPEALAARARYPEFSLIAGCTDLMVGWGSTEAPREAPVGIIDLFGLPGLSGVHASDHVIAIGATTTYSEILNSDLVRDLLPALHDSVRQIGAVQIQNRGTLGGNIGTSSPVGDTLPVLLALDAEIELASARGLRRLPYEQFLTGYRKTALAADELIVAVHVPRPATGTRQQFRKVGTRKAQAISKVMLAAAARRDSDGALTHVRVALGAVADRPIRVRAAENILEGAEPNAATAELARRAVMSSITPIDDVRSTSEYRKTVAGNLVRRFVLSLVP